MVSVYRKIQHAGGVQLRSLISIGLAVQLQAVVCGWPPTVGSFSLLLPQFLDQGHTP